MRIPPVARAFLARRDGATAIEYALIAALVAVVVIAAVSAVGPDLDAPFPLPGADAPDAPAGAAPEAADPGGTAPPEEAPPEG